MTIETKYNIGDEVWLKTFSGKVYCNRITGIHIKTNGLIMYSLLNFADRTEDDLFPTKEELLEFVKHSNVSKIGKNLSKL